MTGDPEDSTPSRSDAALERTALDEEGADAGQQAAPTVVRIGRFFVLEEIGAGAMGVVFAAYDEALDRKVALKLLKVQGRSAEDRRARLLREAQALARLSHPNVVQVYEVGTHGERVFVAMEFLVGETLGHWLAAERRDVDAICAVFRQAGHGLVAAHAAGLVHRDFKPENVFVGADGRVRVLDFGLARPASAPDPGSVDAGGVGDPTASGSASLRALTMTGTVMGTPAYMSPEQFAGEAAGPASDQFGFCVALWEALHGARPFAGRDVVSIAYAVRNGKIRDEPRDPAVPHWLTARIQRGLAVDPAERWPSMQALLDALEPPRSGARRRWLAAAVVAAGLGGAAVATVGEDDPCAGVEAALDETWNDEVRTRLSTAMLGTGLAYASDVAERVEQGIDAWASAWGQARRRACEATHVTHEQSQQLLDLRMSCLERGRAGLEALLGVLVQADAVTLERAGAAVRSLPDPTRCDERERLLARVPPPDDAELGEQVEGVRREAARARALGDAGRYTEARTLLEELETRAQALDYPPLRAELGVALAPIQRELGALAQAEQTAGRAFDLALEVGDDESAREAAALACQLAGYLGQRYPEGLLWGRTALALARKEGERTLAYARALDSVGSIHFRRGDYEEAIPYFETALELEREIAPDDEAEISRALNNVSAVHYYLGQRDQAVAELAEAIELAERVHGPNHPEVGILYQNLAALASYREDRATMRTYYERAFEIALASRGELHPSVAVPLASLGKLDLDEGRRDRARERLERSLRIITTVSGEASVDRSAPLTHLGTLAAGEGHPDQAQRRFEEALDVVQRTVGDRHPQMCAPLEGLAELLVDRDAPRAVELAERSIAIHEERGHDARRLARALSIAARARRAAADPSRARDLADRAAALFEAQGMQEDLERLRAAGL